MYRGGIPPHGQVLSHPQPAARLRAPAARQPLAPHLPAPARAGAGRPARGFPAGAVS